MTALRPFAPTTFIRQTMSPKRSSFALPIALSVLAACSNPDPAAPVGPGGADAAGPGLDRQLDTRRRPARHGQQDLAVGRQRAGADPLFDGRRPRLRLGGRPAPHLRRRMAGQHRARRRAASRSPRSACAIPACACRASAPTGAAVPAGQMFYEMAERESGRPAADHTAAPRRCSCSRRHRPPAESRPRRLEVVCTGDAGRVD